MLSDDVVDTLAQNCFCYLGTCTAERVPQIHRVYGWQLSGDHATLRFFVPFEYMPGLESALADNAQGAVTITEATTSVTYQLKGRIEHTEPPTAADLAHFEAYRDGVMDILAGMLGPEVAEKKAMLGPPALALTLRIRQVFEQTPGPNAGRLVFEVQP